MDNIEKIKKNQHIVSKFLLRKFKTSNKKYSKELLVRNTKDFIDFSKKPIKYKDNIFSIDPSLVKNVSAKDEIFVEDYFYDLTKKFIYSKDDVNYPIYIQDLEDVYSVIEKNASSCISKIEKNILKDCFTLEQQDNENLINLFIAFEMKGRKFYETIEKLKKKEYLKNILNSNNNELKKNLSLINEMQIHNNKNKLTTLETLLLNSYLLAIMHYDGNNIDIADYTKQMTIIMNKPWKLGDKNEGYNMMIIKNFSGIDFLLGDEPLFTVYDKNLIKKIFSNYFDCSQCDEIKIMPITPKIALLSTKIKVLENDNFEINKEDVRKINSLEVFNSHSSFVVTDDLVVDDLIDKNLLIRLSDSVFRKQIINKLHKKIFGN